MTDALLVGIDVGTSRCKVVVLGDDGAERGLGARTTPWRHGPDGAVELDAPALLGAVVGACTAALAGVPGQVVGVGVASMAEAGFLYDDAGQVIAPALGWHDLRASDHADRLAQDLPRFTEVTGLPVTARPTAVKHRWRVAHHPHLAGAAGWSNVAEHVVAALGGQRVCEPSLASRTGWLDVERLAWWSEALEWSGGHPGLLAELRPAGAAAGRVGDVDRLSGAVLTVAGHDHLCAAVGAGALTTDDIVDSCGSAEVLLRAVPPGMDPAARDRAARLGFTSGRHVLPDLLALIGGFRSGGLLSDLADALGFTSPADADRAAAQLATSPEVRTIEQLPPLIGSLRQEQGSLDRRSAAGLWRAGVEAVAAQAAKLSRDVVAQTGPAERVLAVGGSAQVGLVAEARARHLGPVEHPHVVEAAGRGAALFAGVAAGLHDSVAAAPKPAAASSSPGGVGSPVTRTAR